MTSEASNEGSPQTPSSDFPMEAVRHLAEGWHCRCQSNAIHVERNVHWPSCMVGKAQAFLGRKVTFCNPNNPLSVLTHSGESANAGGEA